jgi:hypothetical protein
MCVRAGARGASGHSKEAVHMPLWDVTGCPPPTSPNVYAGQAGTFQGPSEAKTGGTGQGAAGCGPPGRRGSDAFLGWRRLPPSAEGPLSCLVMQVESRATELAQRHSEQQQRLLTAQRSAQVRGSVSYLQGSPGAEEASKGRQDTDLHPMPPAVHRRLAGGRSARRRCGTTQNRACAEGEGSPGRAHDAGRPPSLRFPLTVAICSGCQAKEAAVLQLRLDTLRQAPRKGTDSPNPSGLHTRNGTPLQVGFLRRTVKLPLQLSSRYGPG